MAKQDEQPDRDSQGKKPAHVGSSPAVWAVFLGIVLSALLADLWLKYWAFHHVADTPIQVRTAETGGPEVLVQSPETDRWTVAHKIGLTGDPRVVPNHQPTVVVPALLNFQLTLNTGAVFGIGQGGRTFFIVISVIATAVILVLLYRSPPGAWFYQAGLALILGGALGNLYDRARYSAVRDMLHMLPELGLWPWIFNIADVALVIGVCVVLVVSWVTESRRAKQAKAAT